jgi:hypothetical protein
MKFTITIYIPDPEDEEAVRLVAHNALAQEAVRVWRSGLKSHDIRADWLTAAPIIGRLQLEEQSCLSN